MTVGLEQRCVGRPGLRGSKNPDSNPDFGSGFWASILPITPIRTEIRTLGPDYLAFFFAFGSYPDPKTSFPDNFPDICAERLRKRPSNRLSGHFSDKCPDSVHTFAPSSDCVSIERSNAE